MTGETAPPGQNIGQDSPFFLQEKQSLTIPIGNFTEEVHLETTYLREVARIPLLTPIQEKQYFQEMTEDTTFQEYIQQLRALQSDRKTNNKVIAALDRRDQKELFWAKDAKISQEMVTTQKLIRDTYGGHRFEQILEANLRMVVDIAKEFQGRGLRLIDLIQEGNIGLIEAILRFDYTQEKKLSTYANPWIKKAIRTALRTSGRTISLPQDVAEEVDKILHLKHVGNLIGEDPATQDLATAVGKSPEYVNHLTRVSQLPISLQAENDEGDELGDIIPFPYRPTFLEEEITPTHRALQNVLNPKQYAAFVFHHELGWSAEEIGPEIEVSRQRAAQLLEEAKAILATPEVQEQLQAS